MKSCPYCQANDHQMKAGRTAAGSQRYRCGRCQRRYTPEVKEHGYPDGMRQQAVRLYSDGLNYRRIGRILGVDHVSVMLWVKAHAELLPTQTPVPQDVGVVELDELFSFIGAKKSESMS
jgi:transposase